MKAWFLRHPNVSIVLCAIMGFIQFDGVRAEFTDGSVLWACLSLVAGIGWVSLALKMWDRT